MIEIHLLGEMIPLQIEATRNKYENMRENLYIRNITSIIIGDYIINYDHIIYMEYVEEKK